eukprot:TRINITY_DN63_c0_g1_i7.p1 TRINITY_DN63_c0_g1~~TRINITY_DN63_c0_g1_i7.p1  ORF type:complete len:984 (-),score=321.01 TRINITY_DN63_c0_g1_i7:36-2870(-)
MTPARRALLRFLAVHAQTCGASPFVFLSYAWPVDSAQLAQIQDFLKQLAADLRTAGAADVFLDIERMNGSTAEYMETHIAKSDIIVVVCSERMKTRGNDAKTNAALELRAATKRAAAGQAVVVPVLYDGDLHSSVPALIEPYVGAYVDCSDHTQYEANVVQLLPALFPRAATPASAVAQVLSAVQAPSAIVGAFLGRVKSDSSVAKVRVAVVSVLPDASVPLERERVRRIVVRVEQDLSAAGVEVVGDIEAAERIVAVATAASHDQIAALPAGKTVCAVVDASAVPEQLRSAPSVDLSGTPGEYPLQLAVLLSALCGPNDALAQHTAWLRGRLDYAAGRVPALVKQLHARFTSQAEADDLAGQLAAFVPPDACLSSALLDDDRAPLAARLAPFVSQADRTGAAPVCVVLGESGSGKSLALRKAEADLLAAYSGPHSLLPIRIDLKVTAAREGSSSGRVCVGAVVEQTLAALCGGSGQQAQLESLRAQQQMVLILDGYDEIAEATGTEVRLFEALRAEVRKWAAPLRIVVSCRTQFLGGSPHPDVLAARFAGAGAVLSGPVHVAPFTPAQIGAFVARSVQTDSALRAELQQALGGAAAAGDVAGECVAAVERVPGLLDLVRSPFLLALALRSLPKLLGRSGAGKVTRAELYETFAGRLFSGEYERRGAVLQRLAAAHPEQTWIADPENDTRGAFEAYCKALAGLLFRTGAVSAQASAGGEAGRLLSESDEVVREIRKGCPLRRNGASVSFVHKSFLEYFAATALVGDTSGGAGSLWSAQLLPRDQRGVMLFVADAVYAERISAEAVLLLDVQEGRKSAPLAQALLGMVVASRGSSSEGAGVAAANALTVLNYGGWTLSGLDLHGVQIAGADLQKALMDRVELRGAVLCGSVGGKRAGVNLSDADMRGSNLSECVFGEEVELGQYASMLVFLVSMLVAVGCQWSHR